VEWGDDFLAVALFQASGNDAHFHYMNATRMSRVQTAIISTQR